MRCSHCDSQIPEGAAFCIECGAPTRAATDKTIQLEAEPVPAVPAPPQLPSAPQRRAASSGRFSQGWHPFASGLSGRSGAIFLIGLGVLFLTGNFWPWVFVLIGFTGAIDELAKGANRAAAQTLVFFIGLAVLFATGFFWPGILFFIGLLALLDRT